MFLIVHLSGSGILMGERIKQRITDFFLKINTAAIIEKMKSLNRFCKSRRGSLVILLCLLAILIFVNLCVFFSFFFLSGEIHLGIPSLFLSEPKIALCLICIFAINFTLLILVRRYLEFSDISFNIMIALINFILVGLTVTLLFGQLYNLEKITVEDKFENKFNLLVGRIPHYEVIQNPLVDKKDIILEQKNTYDVLKNLDDGTTADKTLPSDQTEFVKITRINNGYILFQIVVLISLTAPRLLMPVLVKRRKENQE